ncbi:molybdenum-dependent transcriptional regulator [[Erwinia] mediterraneensis]|uniref:molybdenum-dependent transcriptional regulator n=1 Tax=[Erwinia] mediterraneensis TaxID=2161819 RepID=UPI0010302C37|nr:molybdenum-dependent transcriptional regulator [[Erwinia] mediterraneensis]
MQAEISLNIRLQQKLFADPRRIALLARIQETGSISQGAKLAGISYKSAWDAINEMNQLAEQTLVERATGGKGGGGARLTRYAERLIQLFHLMEQIQQKAFDVLQQDNLPLDSLLAAIARFSLQTSARNQLFGTVIARDNQPVTQHLAVLLADGVTRIRVALTRHSAERLQLDSGKEVLVLIKAPWIHITSADGEYDNQLSGQITTIEPGETQSEVLIRLESGETLCATLSNAEVERQQLQCAMRVTAGFNAEHAIIATLL